MYLKNGIYNRKNDSDDIDLPEFKITITGSSSIRRNLKEFFIEYPQFISYKNFFHNLRGRVITQLLSDHRLGKYDMWDMINSSKLDEYGCLHREAMKQLRTW